MQTVNIKTIDITRCDYALMYQAMQDYTQVRDDQSSNLLILTEHDAVYTLGPTSQQTDVLKQLNDVPYVQTNRGGQITYHGPGQLIVYPLLNLRSLNLKPHAFINLLEKTIMAVLDEMGVAGYSDPDARGIYVAGKKIASIGIRVSRGCTYHGFALNIATNLDYFKHIHPCGLHAMKMVNLNTLCACDIPMIKTRIIQHFKATLEGFSEVKIDISPGEDKLILSYEHG